MDPWQLLKGYRSPKLVERLLDRLSHSVTSPLRFMQVCGTHTWNYLRFGLPHLVPDQLHLIAGPGCPVCATSQGDIDWVISLAEENNCTLAVFGDLMRVPGTKGSLATRAKGQVRVILSPLEAIELAKSDGARRIILAAIGFETTAPTIAAAIQTAAAEGLHNFTVAVLVKRLIPALEPILQRAAVDGLLLPGHVAAVTGEAAFTDTISRLKIPATIAGFEPVDILLGLSDLAEQKRRNKSALTNSYSRAVPFTGNPRANEMVSETFSTDIGGWRGLGLLADTGYRLKPQYEAYGFRHEPQFSDTPSDCICNQIILGKATPPMCRLFGTACTPEQPIGPCMVSREGTCAAYYAHPM